MKIPLHSESATAQCSYFASGLFFVVARAILLHICASYFSLQLLTLTANKLCFWSSYPTLFRNFFHTCNLFTWNPVIGLQIVPSVLYKYLVCVYVEDEWGSLLLYLCEQQLFLLLLYFLGRIVWPLSSCIFRSCVVFASRSTGYSVSWCISGCSRCLQNFRFHISAFRAGIWSSWYLICVVRFEFVVVSLVSKRRISGNSELLYHFDMVKEFFNWLFHMVQFLYLILILS